METSLIKSRQSKFQTEEELVLSFIKFQKKTKPKEFNFVREFDGGLGLADLVFFRCNKKEQHATIQLAEINPRLAVLLDPSFAKNIHTVSDLSSLLGTHLKGAIAIANQLKKIHVISEYGQGNINIKAINNPPFTSIISIEAKLSDWRRGLTQAFRYTQFSDESWLLLDDHARTSALNNIDSFKKSGVGLATFSKKGELFIHLAARNQPASSRSKYWRAQAILARE